MARKSFWSVAGLLAALPLLIGLGIGVHTVIAFGQETPEAADQDATPKADSMRPRTAPVVDASPRPANSAFSERQSRLRM